MKKISILLSLLALLYVPTGCSSSGGGLGESRFRHDMGRLLAGPLSVTRERIWGQRQIPLWREQMDGSRIVWESNWVQRAPTPEEEAAGVVAAQNQVILRGRRVEDGLDMSGTVYRVTFEAFNQVRTNLNSEWHPAPMPESMEEFYRETVTLMEMELRTGIRR